jgi:hypothetical protein
MGHDAGSHREYSDVFSGFFRSGVNSSASFPFLRSRPFFIFSPIAWNNARELFGRHGANTSTGSSITPDTFNY